MKSGIKLLPDNKIKIRTDKNIMGSQFDVWSGVRGCFLNSLKFFNITDTQGKRIKSTRIIYALYIFIRENTFAYFTFFTKRLFLNFFNI